jgi:two-component system, chemotaxis family, protein-glutamate methylesterase/glutaminase
MRVRCYDAETVDTPVPAAAGRPMATPWPPYEAVGLAASAGGLAALSIVLGRLPADLPAAVVVVQHLDPRHGSLLAEILGRRTKLRVVQAQDADELKPGSVYLAPPDHHLLINRGSLSLSQTELVHFVRPSADLMFESLAAAYGPRAIGVVLTGSGSDASGGICAIKDRGGTTIAQDEATSQFFGMPGASMKTGCVDFVLALDEIAPAVVALVMRGAVG